MPLGRTSAHKRKCLHIGDSLTVLVMIQRNSRKIMFDTPRRLVRLACQVRVQACSDLENATLPLASLSSAGTPWSTPPPRSARAPSSESGGEAVNSVGPCMRLTVCEPSDESDPTRPAAPCRARVQRTWQPVSTYPPGKRSWRHSTICSSRSAVPQKEQ